MQVNMVIPAGISRIGAISIQVTVGNATSPPGTTIFVAGQSTAVAQASAPGMTIGGRVPKKRSHVLTVRNRRQAELELGVQ